MRYWGILLLLSSGVWGWAQNIPADDPSLSQEFKQIAPQKVPAPASVQNKPESKPEPKAKTRDSQKVLFEELKGLVLIASPERVQQEGYTSLDGLPDTDGIVLMDGVTPPMPEEFVEKLKPFIGKPVSRAKINAIIKEVIMFYRGNDYPLVDVSLPEQAMPAGIIQLVVREGRLGNVSVEGNEYFNSREILDTVRTKPGSRIRQSVMREDITWLNANPFRTAELIYEPGEVPGYTDAVVKVKDRFPARFYAGYNDSGNRLTSYETLVGGVNWGKPFGTADQLNYQYTTRFKNSYLKAHSLTYINQLPWRHTLTVLGSHSDSVINGSRIGAPVLTGESTSWSLGARYQMPLRWTELEDSLTLGYDFKRSEGGFAVLGTVLPGTVTDASQFSGTYQVSLPIPKGALMLSSTLIYSPGGMGGHNNPASFTAANAGDPEYSIIKLNATAMRSLPKGYSLIVQSSYQDSSERLLGSEGFSLGGMGTVRGYDASEVSGDRGLLVVSEIHTPPTPLLSRFGYENLPKESLKFVGFFDWGTLKAFRPDPSFGSYTTLASLGAGLRYNLGQYLTMNLDYGFQLRDSGASQTSRNTRNQRMHVSVQASF